MWYCFLPVQNRHMCPKLKTGTPVSQNEILRLNAILSELKEIDWRSVEGVCNDLKSIKVSETINDRLHCLTINIPEFYPTQKPNYEVQLPVAVKFTV